MALLSYYEWFENWETVQYWTECGDLTGGGTGGRSQNPEQCVGIYRCGLRRWRSCVFTNVINPRAFIERKNEYRRTVVKKGASIGANATIVCGHDIGRYAFVGAGAVVTKTVPDYAMVYGCPAEVKGYVCQCGEQLNFQAGRAACPACDKQYEQDQNLTVKEIF